LDNIENNRKKDNTLKYILLAITVLILTPLTHLLLITHLNVIKYPESIKPSGEFCLEGYFLLPNIIDLNTSSDITIKVKDKYTIFENLDIFAKKICITPTQLLSESNQYIFTLKYFNNLELSILEKHLKITTQEYPEVIATDFDNEINSNQILKYEIDYPIDFLEYYISSNEKSVTCNKDNSSLLCDLSDLEMIPENSYDLLLLAKNSGEIVKQMDIREVTILTPIIVVDSSIKEKEIVQTLTIPAIETIFNKEINTEFAITFEDSDKNPITFEYTVEANKLLIIPLESFKQSNTYLLRVENLTGVDGSKMVGGYVLEFTIDSGPKIKSTNLFNGFPTGDNIVLTFNQDIKGTQNIKSLIRLDPSAEYSYSIKKNQITINPKNNLNLCKNYTLNISKGLLGSGELLSTEGYSKTFKTTCKRVVNVGTSVQGRAIYASYFGSGSKKILFFGAMHGSEANTKNTMNKWIAELESNSDRIPVDKTIIVVPTFNPDGIANKSRFNANGVDLNRNFASSSWVSGTYFLNNFYETGGGLSPFSEPESIAIKNLVVRESPYITLSYHSAAGYTVPSNTSNSIELAKIYSQLSGYRYIAPGTVGAFTYDITGTFEGWAGESGYNAIVIELSSAYTDQFIQNKIAMWEMITQ